LLLKYTTEILPKLLSPNQSCFYVDPGWVISPLGGTHAKETIEGVSRI